MNEFKQLFKDLAVKALEEDDMATHAQGTIKLKDGSVLEFSMTFEVMKITNAQGETWKREHE
jgi:hypothetical protein